MRFVVLQIINFDYCILDAKSKNFLKSLKYIKNFLFCSGDIAAYHLDDTNGAMTQTFRIKLSIKDGTEYLSYIGRVKQIHCLPQGLVFAVSWDFNVKEENGKNGNCKFHC